jgi:hypothetical protein
MPNPVNYLELPETHFRIITGEYPKLAGDDIWIRADEIDVHIEVNEDGIAYIVGAYTPGKQEAYIPPGDYAETLREVERRRYE